VFEQREGDIGVLNVYGLTRMALFSRGSGPQAIFLADGDRGLFLDLLQAFSERFKRFKKILAMTESREGDTRH